MHYANFGKELMLAWERTRCVSPPVSQHLAKLVKFHAETPEKIFELKGFTKRKDLMDKYTLVQSTITLYNHQYDDLKKKIESLPKHNIDRQELASLLHLVEKQKIFFKNLRTNAINAYEAEDATLASREKKFSFFGLR